MIGRDEKISRENRVAITRLKWLRLVEIRLSELRLFIQKHPDATVVDNITDIPDPGISALSHKYNIEFQMPDSKQPYKWMFISEHNGRIKLFLKGCIDSGCSN